MTKEDWLDCAARLAGAWRTPLPEATIDLWFTSWASREFVAYEDVLRAIEQLSYTSEALPSMAVLADVTVAKRQTRQTTGERRTLRTLSVPAAMPVDVARWQAVRAALRVLEPDHPARVYNRAVAAQWQLYDEDDEAEAPDWTVHLAELERLIAEAGPLPAEPAPRREGLTSVDEAVAEALRRGA